MGKGCKQMSLRYESDARYHLNEANEILDSLHHKLETMEQTIETLNRELMTKESSNDSELRTIWRIVDALRAENALLIHDKENLEKENRDLKSRLHEESIGDADKDDKIQALRAMARALENENSLIIDDNTKYKMLVIDKQREIDANHVEKSIILKRIEGLETEKTTILEGLTDTKDALYALRDGKRVVESKLAESIRIRSELETRSQNYERRVSYLETELGKRETLLAEKVSFYENEICEMQRELDRRIDEITSSKEETVERIKTRYVDLFHEKAQELHQVRSQYEDSILRWKSSERARIEIENELRDVQVKFGECNQINSEKIQELESYVRSINDQFQVLRSTCQMSLQSLQSRLKSNQSNGI